MELGEFCIEFSTESFVIVSCLYHSVGLGKHFVTVANVLRTWFPRAASPLPPPSWAIDLEGQPEQDRRALGLRVGGSQQASSRLLSSEGTARVLLPLFLHSLRSGSDVQDYSLTGYVWSAVTPSPEHLGDEVNLKVTVLCDSIQEPLTFTCNCKWGGRMSIP